MALGQESKECICHLYMYIEVFGLEVFLIQFKYIFYEGLNPYGVLKSSNSFKSIVEFLLIPLLFKQFDKTVRVIIT